MVVAAGVELASQGHGSVSEDLPASNLQHHSLGDEARLPVPLKAAGQSVQDASDAAAYAPPLFKGSPRKSVAAGALLSRYAATPANGEEGVEYLYQQDELQMLESQRVRLVHSPSPCFGSDDDDHDGDEEDDGDGDDDDMGDVDDSLEPDEEDMSDDDNHFKVMDDAGDVDVVVVVDDDDDEVGVGDDDHNDEENDQDDEQDEDVSAEADQLTDLDFDAPRALPALWHSSWHEHGHGHRINLDQSEGEDGDDRVTLSDAIEDAVTFGTGGPYSVTLSRSDPSGDVVRDSHVAFDMTTSSRVRFNPEKRVVKFGADPLVRGPPVVVALGHAV